MEYKEIYLLGVSFRTAPAAVRESLSFDASQAANLLRDSAKENSQLEAAVLSTCNRTEFYLAASPNGTHARDWLIRLRRLRPAAQILREDCRRYQKTGHTAARHLFRVACGLDSAVLGDAQILGQVKRAMAVAGASGTLGRTLEQLFQRAIRAGKRARETTAIGWGAAGVASAIASMIEAQWSEAKLERKILIIGAGKAARDVARHMVKRGLGKLIIINRTFAAATALAAECGGESLPWSSLLDTLVRCDGAVAATAASTPVLSRQLLERALRLRGGRPLLIVDAGLPRNVEAGAPVPLFDIDNIRERQALYVARRQAAIPEVERIIAKEMLGWRRWIATQPMESVIKQVYEQAFRQIGPTAQEIIQSGLSSEARVEEIIRRSYKKLLHDHVRSLRQLSPEHRGGRFQKRNVLLSASLAESP
jgi:glutamyl-tRNA reductase